MKNFVTLTILLVLFVALLEAKKVKDPARQKRDLHDTKLNQPIGNPGAEVVPDEANVPLEEQLSECKQHQKIKPKFSKHTTAYEQCKQECRRRRDEDTLEEYVNQLREELKLAEDRLVVQKEQEKTQQASESQENKV
uniref:Uncharacterized protein n=1 Tax=Acrobeloides nanus TaxID=290746 RepID=A0A914EPT5_9BILA